MRSRSWTFLPAVAAVGLALLLPPGLASAAPPVAPQLRPQTTGTTTGGVQLITGEHVRVTTKAGRRVTSVDHRASGLQHTVISRRVGPKDFFFPAVAEPYLGRVLDPNLFEVGSLGTATGADGRLAVRVSYRGSTAPTIPGVHLTTAAGGTARGYLTPTSAAAFGKALTKQYAADRKAGWTTRSSLFGGVTKISADAAPATVVQPHFVMLTLIIKATGADGKPLPFGFLGVINVDDGRKYVGFAVVEDGEARISVPAGHYSMIGDDFSGSTLNVVTVNEFNVTKAGQVATLDFRTATLKPSVRTPKPATSTGYTFEWDRTDARNLGGLGSSYGLDSPSTLRVAPAPAPATGSVLLTQAYTLAQPGTEDPAYTYDLAAADHRVPTTLAKTFTDDDLGVVSAVYYGDGATRRGSFGRAAVFTSSTFISVNLPPLARPTVRTEYVGARSDGPVQWLEVGMLNYDSFEDPGFIDGPIRSIPAASQRTSRWFRGPLAPAVPTLYGPAFCYNCRSGNTLLVSMAGFTDSDLTHAGETFAAADGLPVARFRLYRGDALLLDQDDSTGAIVTAPAASNRYRAVLDVDRRLSDPVQSTRTQTEWTFTSAKGAGAKDPSDWYCPSGDELTQDCQVLPVVQARVGLPTDLNGRLPARSTTVTVTVAQAQGSATSPITAATLEYRPAGYDWQQVTLVADGNGRYHGTVDNADLRGSNVDLRVSGADRAGSTFRQTVLRAYTVAGS